MPAARESASSRSKSTTCGFTCSQLSNPHSEAGVQSTLVEVLSAFRASLAAVAPPPGLSRALCALWLDAKGDWDGAHEAAQADEGGPGDWVHAYLHRKEGDAGNAAYWYRRAGKPVCPTSLEEEWAAIAEALLQQNAA